MDRKYQPPRPASPVRTDPGRALAAGEVGYSYVAGLNTEMNPGLPVTCAPMVLGTQSFHFEPYGGKAVVLHLDNSVEAPNIRPEDGRVSVGGGRTLFDPTNEVWPDDHPIDLRHPEK